MQNLEHITSCKTPICRNHIQLAVQMCTSESYVCAMDVDYQLKLSTTIGSKWEELANGLAK